MKSKYEVFIFILDSFLPFIVHRSSLCEEADRFAFTRTIVEIKDSSPSCSSSSSSGDNMSDIIYFVCEFMKKKNYRVSEQQSSVLLEIGRVFEMPIQNLLRVEVKEESEDNTQMKASRGTQSFKRRTVVQKLQKMKQSLKDRAKNNSLFFNLEVGEKNTDIEFDILSEKAKQMWDILLLKMEDE